MRAELLISLWAATLLLESGFPSMASNNSQTSNDGGLGYSQLNGNKAPESHPSLRSEVQLREFEDAVAKVFANRAELERDKLNVSDISERQARAKQYRGFVKEAGFKYRQVRALILQEDVDSRLKRDLNEIKQRDQFLFAEITGDRTVYQELWPQPVSSEKEINRFLKNENSILRGFDGPGSR